jgi:DNA-binding PadR family transcriptional regulator
MHEFLILGVLMDGPCHGYGIRRIMERSFGVHRTLAWGTLYATLHRLQETGLIEIAAAGLELEPRNGPPSKWYRITESGRTRFFSYMEIQEAPDADEDLAFILKITRFGHVSLEQRQTLLQHHLDLCLQQIEDLTLWWHQVACEQELPDHERPWILMSIDRRRALAEADSKWVSQQLEALEEREIPEIRKVWPCEAPAGSMLSEEIVQKTD